VVDPVATPTVPNAPSGERRQVTELFADMVGFTAISERLGEEGTFALVLERPFLSLSLRQLSLGPIHHSGKHRPTIGYREVGECRSVLRAPRRRPCGPVPNGVKSARPCISFFAIAFATYRLGHPPSFDDSGLTFDCCDPRRSSSGG
jgi:hypothetical protein